MVFMNFLESKLFFAAAPVSIRKFDKYKKECPEVYQRTSMYMIVKRAVPSIRVVNNDELSDFLEIRGIKERDNKEYAKQLEMYIRDGKAAALDIVQSCSNKRLKGVYKYPKDIFTNHSISLRQDVELEEIMYYSSQGMGTFWARGDIIPFLTYEVMYVGQCVDEPLAVRFKAHHALQDMLIHEDVISKEHSNSDELVIFPLYSESNTVSILTGDLEMDDWNKALSNDFSFGPKDIDRDCEKALVHSMSPKYNCIKFKKYPMSSDGLYNSDADVYCYTINENIILKYNNGLVYGASDDMYASRIIGDKIDKTVTIYAPGEDYIQKYTDRIFPF